MSLLCTPTPSLACKPCPTVPKKPTSKPNLIPHQASTICIFTSHPPRLPNTAADKEQAKNYVEPFRAPHQFDDEDTEESTCEKMEKNSKALFSKAWGAFNSSFGTVAKEIRRAVHQEDATPGAHATPPVGARGVATPLPVPAMPGVVEGGAAAAAAAAGEDVAGEDGVAAAGEDGVAPEGDTDGGQDGPGAGAGELGLT